LGAAVAAAARRLADRLDDGNVGIIVPGALVGLVTGALHAAGIDHGVANRHGLEHPLTVVPVGLVKGLELDGTVVVEPARIVSDEPQGLRALYVALTRATRQLCIVHAAPLPEPLR
jgi:hypothetical protein